MNPTEEEEAEELLPQEHTKALGQLTSRRTPDESQFTKMKKYTKLILSVVAVVSFICFMFYKFRYDRLYNVMQVLEVFGTPDDPAFQPCEIQDEDGPAWLPPTWQSPSPSLHLYSAHCLSSPDPSAPCSKVSVIGAAIPGKLPALQCKLWIEGATKAMEGIFSMEEQKVQGSEEEIYSAFYFSCESKFPDKSPYAVTLYSPGGVESHVPVTQSHTVINKSKTSQKQFLQVCLSPSPSPMDTAAALRENLLFHTFLGVRTILVYSVSLPPSVLATINSLRSLARLNLAPWNPPPSLPPALTSTLVAFDCYHRARHSHEAWMVLTTDQILLPRISTSLTEAAKQLVQGKALTQGPNPVPLKRFCSEYPTEKQTRSFNITLRVFESTFYNKQLSKDENINLNSLEASAGARTASGSDLLTVNEYGACDRHDFSATDKDAQYEPDTLRLSKDFIQYYNKYNKF